MATLTQTKDTIFSKWGFILIAFIFVYVTEGFDIITDNPALLVLVVLGIIIIYKMRGG